MLKQGNTWEPDGGNQFLNAQQDCMKANLIRGTASTVAACIVKATNVSSACGLVWGNQALCMKNHCAFQCARTKLPHPPVSAKIKCASCVCTHCRKMLLEQSKVPCTLVPAEADPDQGCHDCFGHTSHWPPPHNSGAL